MSRVGAGWAVRGGAVAVVVGVALSGVAGISSAQAAVSYQLMVSSSADRSTPAPLDGSTVSGNIYVFTSPETSVYKSVFYIDNPAATGTPFHSEGTAPFDLNGGSPAAAAPYDTRGLTDGQHTITEVVTTTSNVVSTDTATITVDNSVALPPTPTGVTATAGNGYVDLSWDPMSGSTVGFNLYRGTSSVSLTGTPLNGTILLTGTSYHDPTVTNGTTYSYVLQAVDSGGRHVEAAAVQATPTAPPATPPYVLDTSISPDRSAPAVLDGATVSGSIYVFTTPETSVKKTDFWFDNPAMTGTPTHSEATAPYDFVGGSPAAAMPFDTTALANGTHTITQSVTTNSNVVYSFTATFTVSNAVVVPPPPPPPVPTHVTAAAGNGFVDLAWDAATGSTVGFNVYRGTSSTVSLTGTPLNGTTMITDPSYHDATVTNGTTYYYVVQSVDVIGQHSQAATVNAKPSAPVGPAYTLAVSSSSDRSASQNLDGTVISGNAYIYTAPATSVLSVGFWLDDPTMSGPVLHSEATAPYDFAGGSPAAATPYDTRVIADGVHTITQKVTTTSNVVIVTTATFKVVNATTPPPVPTDVTAQAGDGFVDLSWDAKTGTTLGFNLYRGTSPTVSLSGTPLNGTSLLTGTSYHDAAVTDGTTYYYVLSSVDVIGRHSEADTLSATPNPPGSQQISVTPTPIVLSTPSGTTSLVQTATLTNVGGQTLTVTGAALGGTNATQFQIATAPSYPLTLAPGATASIGITFVPTSTGTKSATLTVASDDPATPSDTVAVSGLALANATAEPSLQQIFDAWQIPDSTGDPTPTNIYLPSTYPLGDEAGVQAFVKAGAGKVTVTPLAVYTGSTVTPTVRVGWVPESQTFPRTQVFAVPGAQNRTLQVTPTGASTFDPGSKTFGLYAAFAGRVSYQDDTLNSTVGASFPRQVRVYPFKTAAGVTVPDTWVVAFEDFLGTPTSTSGEWNDTVVVVSNARAETFVARNLDGSPFTDHLTMSRIGTTLAATAGENSHDTATLRYTNTGTTSRQITGATVTGPFTLVAPTSFPVTVPAGGTADVTVKFVAVAGPKGQTGNLTIATDDPNRPLRTVTLGGAWQEFVGGENEPQVTDIIQTAFGFGTIITTSAQSINTDGRVQAVGDEILSPFWQRADTSLPVSIRQIAGYAGGATVLSWYPRTSTSCSGRNSNCVALITQYSPDGQTVYPRHSVSGQLVSTAANFAPTTAFGLKVDSDYSDDTRNTTTYDRTFGCTAAMACGHHIRFWPAKDATGAVIPNTYIMARDTYGSSMDYNDEIYLISNVSPAS